MIDFIPDAYNLRLLRSVHSEGKVGVHWEVLCSLFELTEPDGPKLLVRGFAAIAVITGESYAAAIRTGDYVFPLAERERAEAAMESLFARLSALRAEMLCSDYTVTIAGVS